MEFINNIDADKLVAITSVFTVVISIVSIVFTTIFSILQWKHNKNSVKPISEIRTYDYEDDIAVIIQNVGTGPLLVTKLIVKNDAAESSTLINLMPDIEQEWSTFTGVVDGRTIPVGGELRLIEINPETDEIKTLLRQELSQITILLEYKDIYNTKFYDNKKLDFFSRTL